MMYAPDVGKYRANELIFRRRRFLFLILIVAGCFIFSGCSEKPQAQQPSPAQSTQMSQAQSALSISAPQLSEVREAVKRVFKDAAVIDDGRSPNFLVGDFNGDHSQDVAVILKTAPGKVAEMNQQFPPWILKDPFVKTAPGMAPLRVTEREPLLAVIHGYGAAGWQDSQATQTYLLKNALGENVAARGKADVIAANQGKKLPQLKGDLISEILGGKSGYLYYAESTYSWYDPETFQGEPIARPVHPGFAARN